MGCLLQRKSLQRVVWSTLYFSGSGGSYRLKLNPDIDEQHTRNCRGTQALHSSPLVVREET